MEENTSTTIVIDVKLDDEGVAQRLAQVNKGINELKDSNRDLRKEIKAGNDENGENSKKLAEQEARLKTLKAEQSALSGQVAKATTANRKYGDSLKEMSAKLNDMRSQYQSLSKAERESDVGKTMLKNIQDLDAAMKGADASQGLFQRNVGDYANQIAKISGLFGSAGGAASSMAGQLGLVAKGFGALGATPVIALLTALVAIIQKVATAMKGSEEQTMKWREVMAVFEPLINAMKNGLTALAGILINTVGKAIDIATAGLGKLAQAADWVGRQFGKDWGLKAKTEEMRAQAAAQRELTAAENAYIIQKRQFGVESAKIDRDVADLRAKAVDKENYTNQQRLDFLKQALDMEKARAEEEKRLAQQNLDNLKARAIQTENDAEMNDKLAEAEIAVINADTRLAESQRSMTREMNRLHSEIRQEGVAAWKEYQERQKAVREQYSELMTEIKALKPIAAKPFEEAFEAVQALDTTVSDLPDTLAPSKFEQWAAAFENNEKLITETAQGVSSAFGSMSQIYQQLADDETKSEEERAKAAKKAKAWAALQIAANSGTAIAKGIASAMDTPSFPANIGAMATTLAAVLSAIAQAKALAADTGGFETGGVIGGYHGATMGKDNTAITARTGEMVINANQQRQLFELANGNAVGSNLTASLVTALQSMPSPTVVYTELQRFGDGVAALDELSILK